MDTSVMLNLVTGAIGGIFTIAIPAVVMLKKAWTEVDKSKYELSKSQRGDALTEWKDIAAKYDAQLDQMSKELVELRKEHMSCKVESAKQAIKIDMLQTELNQLKSRVDTKFDRSDTGGL